ncbi:MAG TPA: hypothetical protein PKW95_17000 [bacterium]|nr:hypothetical protein [bacterium]
MKHLALIFAIILSLLVAACEKPLEQTVDDLKSADAQVRQKAIDRLSAEGEQLAPRLASSLSTNDDTERDALFSILRRQGEKALPEMLDKIGYVFRDKKTREGFTEYFRSQGDKGYQALLDELMKTAEQEAGEATGSGSMVKLAALHHRFESLSLILESLDNNVNVGRVPELLKHSHGPVRTRAAYLLCTKNWQPSGDPDVAMIYYTHLVGALACPNVSEPVQDAGRMAAANFKLFLETEAKYPAGADARYQVLAAAGTDEVARYLYDQARATPNEFLLYNYFLVLHNMQTDLAEKLSAKLLADPKLGKSLRALDPRL